MGVATVTPGRETAAPVDGNLRAVRVLTGPERHHSLDGGTQFAFDVLGDGGIVGPTALSGRVKVSMIARPFST